MSADPFILDAGVAIAWFFPETEDERMYAAAVLRTILDGTAAPVVPQHFHIEVAEFLLRRRRTKGAKFGAQAITKTMTALDDLGIETRLIPYVHRNLVEWAQQFHIQAKDSPYFALAYRRKIPLATLDGGLIQACTTHGVARVSFH